jgi:hypothetical protein
VAASGSAPVSGSASAAASGSATATASMAGSVAVTATADARRGVELFEHSREQARFPDRSRLLRVVRLSSDPAAEGFEVGVVPGEADAVRYRRRGFEHAFRAGEVELLEQRQFVSGDEYFERMNGVGLARSPTK